MIYSQCGCRSQYIECQRYAEADCKWMQDCGIPIILTIMEIINGSLSCRVCAISSHEKILVTYPRGNELTQ